MQYLSEFADELVKAVQLYGHDKYAVQNVANTLPELLRTFALSPGHAESPPMQRETMVFIHKYRRNIVTAFEQRMADDNGDMEKRQTEDLSHVHHRPAELQFGDHNTGILNVGHEDDEDADGQELPRLDEYRRLIQGAPTYPWLISNIQNEVTIDDIANNVRNIVLKSLPTARRVSRKKTTGTHNVSFRVNWEPVRFLLEKYQGDPEEAIERALTFTGLVPRYNQKPAPHTCAGHGIQSVGP
ncbi:hypothetical protein BJY00DRAFT_221401 [Aspergillus carlsbadensis]|nr:hypothetical protein BJY00DRAFT_221401 [Aspergillus carlsbadensis]